MTLRNLILTRHLHLIGIAFLIACVVIWMRFSSSSNENASAFRAREPLVTQAKIHRSQHVELVSGLLDGGAESADEIQIWSSEDGILVRTFPTEQHTFTARLKQVASSDIAIIAKSSGKLVAAVSGDDITDFGNITLGMSNRVTFSTVFVDPQHYPTQVNLEGEVRLGRVTFPLNPNTDLKVTRSGELTIPGLPANGFVTLRVCNPEYAITVALTDIALRSNQTRIFPRVKVYPANKISGIVVNSLGRPVPNTKVTIDSNIRRLIVPPIRTDSDGKFAFDRLPNGVYSIQGVSDGQGDMCTHPISGITCTNGTVVNVDELQFLKGNFVEFFVDDSKSNRAQTVFLEVSGHYLGSPWSMIRSLPPKKVSRILLPAGKVALRVSQQPRNGILPSFRNISISPQFLDVRPLAMQRVIVRIDARRS